ncbi:FAD-binding domain-containing protein [Sphingorhabdus sp. EL138]|uniref:FAD-binding domain-containing protein n=1 Tax=Sphingorhabdus sp. EL138 TaxID=2073156 RepID=UPI0025DF6725|nr:FAD-binding domain-containing protein [Sphingorhabdus sp. EL138]
MLGETFPATRNAALLRLTQFAPRAGHAYASGRNTDPGPDQAGAVSKLSPYLRYRMLTEQEVIGATLGQHSLQAAEKYVQEVLWRTYWKGWLEMRPSVWTQYLQERDRQRDSFPNARAIHSAEAGETGIEGFDDWARELLETGYLHNHARMWFASIWIFTLRLPWALGADFFLRHLVDADAASNTLSWRWVAGLQTAGKTYLATSENIARFTNGRFAPKGLATIATMPTETPVCATLPLPYANYFDAHKPAFLLVTPEDLHPESVFGAPAKINGAGVLFDPETLWGDSARSFVEGAAGDAAERVGNSFKCPTKLLNNLDAASVIAQAREVGAEQVITAYAPVGPVADSLARIAPALASEGLPIVQVRRAWDESFWPHATKGFFPFKERIPKILKEMGLSR